jgi:hypothetical protein
VSAINPNKLITIYVVNKFKEGFFEKESNICWPWLISLNQGGYPYFTYNKQYYLAHRVSILQYLGLKVSPLLALHKPECKNKPNCVNWNHLYLGTVRNNAQDSINEGTWSGFQNKGSSNGQAILTELDIFDILKYAEGQMPRSEIAKYFNVSHRHISKIINKEKWKHIK